MEKEKEGKETLDVLYEISNILNTGLDKESLSILVGLCESGANPEALTAIVSQINKESQKN
eukprot:gene343-6757_t